MKEKKVNKEFNGHLINIIIPCYNEEKFIEDVINNVIEYSRFSKKIIVVNDGSTDKTGLVLENLKNKKLIDVLINHNVNLGKGAAIKSGLKQVSEGIIIIQDSDFEYSPNDYQRLLKPIIDGDADVVYGSRFLGGNDAKRVLYFKHRIANSILTFFSNVLTDINLTDMETGYKVFTKKSVEDIVLIEDGFGFEPEITAKLAKKKIRFYEVAISYNGRTYEEGKKIRFKDAIRAIYCIFKYNLLN